MFPRAGRNLFNPRLFGRHRTPRQFLPGEKHHTWGGGRGFHGSQCGRNEDPFRKMEVFMKDMDRKMRNTFDPIREGPFWHPFSRHNRWFWEPPVSAGQRISPVTESLGNAVDISEGSTFKMRFYCNDAKPEDINVTLKENVLTVKIKLVQEGQLSKVTQQLEHQQTLPDGVDASKLESSLSASGELTVFAPRTPPEGPQTITVNRL